MSKLDQWHERLRALVAEAEKDGMRFWIDAQVYEFLVTDSVEKQHNRDYMGSRVVW